MFKKLLIVVFFSLPSLIFSQITKDSSEKKDFVVVEGDTLTMYGDTIYIEEVQIHNQKMDAEQKKQFMLLQNRVYRVYPYAKIASERLISLNANMNKLKSNKEKKRYQKIVENYMENEFKAQLKKLSRKQGQILVKLIHRQTGITTFDLIKEYKSGWKAFWSNNTAKLFDINLKTKFTPYTNNEDYLIETILFRAFNKGRLIEQPASTPIDYEELNNYWQQKAIEIKK
ncbi:DUF4294 domain-containing protein [Flavobacterium sp.]|uniref:DUF4294 domain-containing protein n=1 Tax=Flavobacterium sp. TaxID=239 RepID=UPI002637D83A|nr:DUF4294 domain-containing protein [Flavobacterium sp.]